MKKFYTTGSVAEILGISRHTVYAWIKKGLVKAGKTLGGQYRIPAEEVERLLKELRGEE